MVYLMIRLKKKIKLDVRVILSIKAQSVFGLEPSAWARWKGILIENI
jgi:hypothetical protein